jgi:hypothetical protein
MISMYSTQSCVGPQVPASTVSLGESSVFCDSNSVVVDVRHVVTLGAFCEGLPLYFSGDLFFECAEQEYNFEVFANRFGKEGERFACFESVTLPIGSTQSTTKLLPSVAVTTDAFWLSGGDGRCFDQTLLNVTSAGTPPPTVPIPATNPPIAPQPTISNSNPTNAPIAVPVAPFNSPLSITTLKPANAPTSAPAVPISPFTPLPVDLQSEESSNSGVVVGSVIGGIGAGIAIMAVIGFFWLRKKQTQTRPKGRMAEIPSKTFSVKGSSRFLDDAQYTESTGESDNLPPPSFCQPAMSAPSIVRPTPTPTNYEVAYKDQSRSVIEPVLPPLALSADGEHLPMVAEEHIPFAVAVSTALPSGNHVEWAQAEPMSPSQEGLFHI